MLKSIWSTIWSFSKINPLASQILIDHIIDYICVLNRNASWGCCMSTYAAGNVCLHLRIPASHYLYVQENWKQTQIQIKVIDRAVLQYKPQN